jgi:mannose-6-phosphate isomerase-like protein (cupin superfamily)
MSYDKVHRDDFEMNGNWALARRSLGVESFGINLVSIDAGEQIPEHDELDRDHEEVFIVLTGSPAIVIDGDEMPIETGSFVRIDPEHKRTVRNIGETVSDVLIVSAPRSSGYEPMGWA